MHSTDIGKESVLGLAVKREVTPAAREFYPCGCCKCTSLSDCNNYNCFLAITPNDESEGFTASNDVAISCLQT